MAMNNEGGPVGPVRAAWEAGGTILTGIVTAIVVAIGLATMWIMALSQLPWWLGLGAIAGMAVAPFQFVLDILRIDRDQRGVSRENGTKVEDDGAGLKGEAPQTS